MARITAEEQVEYPTLPKDSILLLRIESVKIDTLDGRNGSWEKINFFFNILAIQVTGDGSPVDKYQSLIGQTIKGSPGTFRLTDSRENRLKLWTEAILGVEVGVGFELDTDFFMNRQVRGVTSTYEKRATDSFGRHFEGHQVESLLPVGDQAPVSSQQFVNPTGQQSVQQQPQQQQLANSMVGQTVQPQTTPPADPWADAGSGGWDDSDPPF